MRQKIIVVFTLMYCAMHVLLAQHYHFKQYSLEEGLPQSEIFALAEDQFGYLWVGTNGGGLCRFNGKDFEVFTKKDGLLDNLVLGLIHDKNYNLWIASNKGVQRYNGINYQPVIKSDTTIFSDNVDFCETSDGKIWCLAKLISGEQNIYQFSDDDWVNITDQYEELRMAGRIFRIMPESDNSLLIACRKQLFSLKDGVLSEYEIDKQGDKIARLPLMRDRNKNLWYTSFSAKEDPKLIIQLRDKKLKEIKLPDRLQGKVIFGGMQDREGVYWFLIERGGVAQFSKKNGWEVFDKQNGLPINSVYNILQDAEGNIWMGTLGAGMVRYSGNLFLSINRSNGLTDDIIRTIYADSKGNFYFADGEGGFSVFKDGLVTPYPSNSIADFKSIKKFKELPNGNLLLGTTNGLWEYTGKKAFPVNERYGWKKPLPIADIVQVKDTLYFATYGYGLIKSYKGKADFYNSYNSNMQDNTIHHILADSKNRLWLSTSRGIIMYENNTFTPFVEGKEIPASYILQAAEDKVGNIWFASFTDGLIRYDNNSWSVFDTKKRLSSDNIYSVIAGADGNIFAGAQNGVDKLSISSSGNIVSVTNYDKHDGFIGIENNGTANFLDKNGNIWFGTIKGVMRYNPMEKRTNFLPPGVYIRDIELSYKNPDWKSDAYKATYDSIVPWFGIPNQLSLSSDDNNISFTFDALCYTVPEKVNYMWRLEPIESEWIEGSDNTVAYPSLPAGDYTFRVTASNNNNIVNEEGAIYQFSIHPVWYRTTSFRALVIVLILGLIGTFILSWQQKSKSRSFEFQTLIAAKTREINKQKNTIESQKSKLEEKDDKISEQAQSINDATINLKRLNRIGEILTTNLSIDNIFDLVYKALSEVMDTHLFGFGLINEETNSLDFKNVIHKGERMPFITFPLDDVERLAIYSVVNNKEVFINDFNTEYKNYVNEIRPVPGDINSQSVIYLPLKVGEKPFGVMTVQSGDINAYSQYHMSLMQNISLYTSIALENANAFNQLKKQSESLKEANEKAQEQDEQMHRQQDDVVRLNEENNQLITLFTREIERPISSSVSLISSIQSEEEINEQEKDEALQYVFDALWQIKEMVNQVSEIKKLESGEIEAQRSKVSVATMTQALVTQYSKQLEEKEVTIDWQIENDIVETDYAILEKVISNLLSNAIKFTDEETTITIASIQSNEQSEISISDEGPGIPQDKIAGLFAKYKKLEDGQNKPSTGLGLYIVKRYIDALDGSITCESILNKGTTFKISLPK